MLVRPLVPEKTLARVFSRQGRRRPGIGVAAPQVDHQITVDPHRDRGADVAVCRLKLRSKASRTESNRGVHLPPIEVWSLRVMSGRLLAEDKPASATARGSGLSCRLQLAGLSRIYVFSA